MSTIVIAATELELSWLAERLHARTDRMLLDFPVSRASGDSADILLVTSGPGMANAAAACAAAIERYGPARVFNVGICGVFSDNNTLLGMAAAGASAVFADTGAAQDHGFKLLPALHLPLARSEGSAIYNRIALSHDTVPADIARADFLTVASISGSSAMAATLCGRFPPTAGALLCEDMESAAVGLVALRAGLPCTVVRGISNLCGERDHARWDIRGAARSAQETLYTLLQQ